MKKVNPATLGCGIVVFFGQKMLAANAMKVYLKERCANGAAAVVVHAEANKCEFTGGESRVRSGSWRENILCALKNDPDIVAIDDIRLAPDMLVLVAESGLLAVTASSCDNEEDVFDYLCGVGGLREPDRGRVLCIPA